MLRSTCEQDQEDHGWEYEKACNGNTEPVEVGAEISTGLLHKVHGLADHGQQKFIVGAGNAYR
jgi:hypothetical protein